MSKQQIYLNNLKIPEVSNFTSLFDTLEMELKPEDPNADGPRYVDYHPPKAQPKEQPKPKDAKEWKKVGHNVQQPDKF